jgi:hypothetical protein
MAVSAICSIVWVDSTVFGQNRLNVDAMQQAFHPSACSLHEDLKATNPLQEVIAEWDKRPFVR